jgi:uncharacterized OB-fold protein
MSPEPESECREEIASLETKNAMLQQISGELCEKCGWAMKFPDAPCRCELELENVELKEKMTEAWKLVNAMAGQEYWQRAEDWLAENIKFAPQEIISANQGDCVWKFHSGHGGEWETSCGTWYDADDFGCSTIRKCPKCGKKTTTEEDHMRKVRQIFDQQ